MYIRQYNIKINSTLHWLYKTWNLQHDR